MSQGILGGLFSQRGSHGMSATAVLDAPPEADAGYESNRLFEYALDAMPCNAMFCDRELTLRYLNKASKKTLRSLQQYLPVQVDQIVGNSIHIFHKSPPNIDRILGAKQHQERHELPHKATISLGPVKLDLNVEPMTDEHGAYVGAVVLWGVSTQQTMDALRKAQEAQRNDIEHLNGNIQLVATATEQIQASIGEIAQNAQKIATAAGQSREASEESKTTIDKLRGSSAGVAKVADLIAGIATQTSVLALNANIEAARAGVHGKGFAVVAGEVRRLAEQTAKATGEIQAKVSLIGVDISSAMSAIDRIVHQTDDLSGLSLQLASASEEQHLATQEMAHNLERAAFRAAEIAKMRIEEKAL